MRSRYLTLASILVLIALAGCIGGTPADTDAPTNDSPTVVEDPDNYTYVDNASFETGGHVHDYWAGQDKLTVLDKTLAEGSTCFCPPRPIETFRSDKGKVVPQGTETVEITIDWTEAPYSVYDRVELWVQTAAQNEAHRVAEIQQGDTVTIDSTNADNDLPHRQLSAWKFHFVLHPVNVSAAGATVTGFWEFDGEISMEVVAHRGLELPVFPAHPDHWDNRSKIELLSTDHYVRYEGDPTSDSWACFGGCPIIHSPDNGTIVPFDTEVIEVRFSYSPTTPGTEMGLKYHPADTWEWSALEPDSTEDGTRIYRIPVESGTADSPYATQSIWEFVPYPTQPQEDGWIDGEYTLTATAIRDAAS